KTMPDSAKFHEKRRIYPKSVIARQFERSENNEASVQSTDPHLQIHESNFGLPRFCYAESRNDEKNKRTRFCKSQNLP
ncbi:hypothetical protein ACWIUD_10695, partial [Helicobacter sp. 23-1044]